MIPELEAILRASAGKAPEAVGEEIVGLVSQKRRERFVLEAEWSRESSTDPVRAALIGTFPTREAAFDWAHRNIRNGSWEARPLADPDTVLADDAP